MLPIGYDILDFVDRTNLRTRGEVWQHFGMANYKLVNDCIAQLVGQDLLRKSRSDLPNLEKLYITLKGKECLSAHKQVAKKAAQDVADKKAEKKRDRVFQLLNTLIGAILGSLLTLLVEHYSEIRDFFIARF